MTYLLEVEENVRQMFRACRSRIQASVLIPGLHAALTGNSNEVFNEQCDTGGGEKTRIAKGR